MLNHRFITRFLLPLAIFLLVSFGFAISAETAASVDAAASNVIINSHFTGCATETGDNASIAIPYTTPWTLDGQSITLSVDDEVAIFNSDGSLCVGHLRIDQVTSGWAIAPWGNNIQTSTIDGMLGGETMQFRLWRAGTQTEYLLEPTFLGGVSTYQSNDLYVMLSVTLTALASPPTSIPTNTPSPTPTNTPTPTSTPTNTPSPTPTSTPSPTLTNTPVSTPPPPPETNECPTDWLTTLSIGEGDPLSAEFSLVFGASSTTIEGNDGLPCDIMAPPPPPSSIYSFLKSPNHENQSLLQDIRTTDQPTEWLLTAILSDVDNYPLTLAWDPAALPASGSCRLFNTTYYDGLSDEREARVIDMYTVSSATFYQLDGFASSLRERQFTILCSPLEVTHDVNNNAPEPGQTVQYTAVVNNTGAFPIEGISVALDAPAGLAFVDGSITLLPANAGSIGDSQTLINDLTLAAGAQATVIYEMQVVETAIGAQLTNTVNVTNTNITSPISAESYLVTTDGNPPTLHLPGDFSQIATEATGVEVTFIVTATDSVDLTPAVSCSPISGSQFPLGETVVSCTATDDAGHQTSGAFTVEVIYQQTVSVQPGWNLMSIPLLADDMSVAAIFPDATATYAYSGITYQLVDTFTNGVGYWVHFDAPYTYHVTGQPIFDQQVTTQAGWSMIGLFHEPVSNIEFSSSAEFDPVFFGYNAPQYEILETLHPWRGYWVKTPVEGVLNWNIQQRMQEDRHHLAPCSAGWSLPLSVSNNAINHQLTIGFATNANEAVDTNCGEFELPPVAPAVFDARLVLPNGIHSWVDYRPQSSPIWQIELNNEVGDSIIEWDHVLLSGANATLRIIDHAQITEIDMSEHSSVTVPEGSFVSIEIKQIPSAVELHRLKTQTPFDPRLSFLLLACLLILTIRASHLEKS